MIFMTVGGDLPFARLTKHFDLWCKANPDKTALAQIGPLQATNPSPDTVEWVEMLAAPKFSEICKQADVIVAHAGMGSIISALSLGVPIVLMPRRAEFKEHRNDHQLATVEKFEGRPGIFVAWDEGDLDRTILEALSFAKQDNVQTISRYAPDAFTDRLRGFILGDA